MITIVKKETMGGDTYAKVTLDGQCVLNTLWMGETDQELCDEAAKHMLRGKTAFFSQDFLPTNPT